MASNLVSSSSAIERLRGLRAHMADKGVDFFLVP